MYDSERETAIGKYFPDGFDELDAAEVVGEHLLGTATDHLLELGRVERERIFNLGYYTWVEQQGVSLEDFQARRDLAFWSGAARGRRRLGRPDRRSQRPNGCPGVVVRRLSSATRLRGLRRLAGSLASVPFRCPNAERGDDVDHVLRRELDLSTVRFPDGDEEPNPFVRYRQLLHAYHLALGGGLSDRAFCELVREPRRSRSPRSTGTASRSRLSRGAPG